MQSVDHVEFCEFKIFMLLFMYYNIIIYPLSLTIPQKNTVMLEYV